MRRLALLLLIPSWLQGQSRCTDSLAGASWRSTPLRVAVTTPPRGERDIERYMDGVVSLLAQHYRDPSAALQRPGSMISVPGEGERRPISGEVTVTFDRKGQLLAARLTRGSGIAAVDSAILAATREAGSGRGFGKVPRKFRGDTLVATLAISDRHPASAHTAPLGSYSTSYLVADVPPRIRSMPPARAPRGRRGRQVMLAATVSSAGRVVPGSIRVVQTNDSSLVPIARRSLERTVYRPGTRNGCPAEAYIRQNFPFP